MRYLLAVLSIAISMLWGSAASALDPPPSYGQWIVDNGKLLSRKDHAEITYKLLSIERETGRRGKGAQVAVLTVKSLQGDDIKDFALRTARAWKLGVKGAGSQGKSNGVLILVVKDSARVRIEVGAGLEGVLTDARTSQLIREHFASGANKTAGDALKGLVDDLTKDIFREDGVQPPAASAQPTPEVFSQDARKGNGDRRLIVFGVAIIFAGILGAIFHRRRRKLRFWFGGAVGAVSWYGVSLLYALTSPVLWLVVAAGYVLGYLLSALFRHGGDGWLFDPFPHPMGVGPGGSAGEGLRGGGGQFAGGGSDAGADPGLFDGVGDALSNIQPPSDCPDLGGCDVGGCDIGGC